MRKVILALLFCLSLLNCAKKDEKITVNNKPYVISHEDRELQKYSDSLKRNKSKIKVMSTKGFCYGESQLIVDKKGDFFYYQNEYVQILCDYGYENDSIPYFLNLHPKDIVKIPPKSLNDFISENILTKEKRRQILVIASQNDTIKNEYLLNFLKSGIARTYYIRRTTQEEDTVLKYKNNSDYYYADSIKWDKTKIKFPKQ